MIQTSKRRSERVFTSLEVLFAGEDGTVERGTVTNMSEHGIFVRTNSSQPPGRMPFFEIHLPDGSPIGVYGFVCYTGPTVAGHGMGVELLSLSYYEQERWLELYHGLLPALEAEDKAA